MRKRHIHFPTARLFAWYDKQGRDLPWRRRWPELAPAYHVWLSEIMLQQTVVATVIPYFLDFTRRWPTVNALAGATLDDVLAAWAGLGYYARARNLHKTAAIVAEKWGGEFYCPDDGTTFSDNDWDRHFRNLPGIGPYTAGAIAAIAFGKQAVVVDGNIERLFSRYFGIETPLPAAKTEIIVAYQSLLPVGRPSDFPQALMDFSNAVCTPKRPGCEKCCLASSCIALAKGVTEELPIKPPKVEKLLRRAIVFVAINHLGEVFLQRRPEKGLLGGMFGFPEIGLSAKTMDFSLDQKMAPFPAEWGLLDETVVHVFTHFALEAHIYRAQIDGKPYPSSGSGQWQKPRPSDLPSLMRKIWMTARPER
ncbi:A/G-specific adenine glycosylase [Candidatus Puniceispirillum sp.]|nr:A/G-specific adenine glycosylase [Candidatus Puniceispirillum sp.]